LVADLFLLLLLAKKTDPVLDHKILTGGIERPHSLCADILFWKNRKSLKRRDPRIDFRFCSLRHAFVQPTMNFVFSPFADEIEERPCIHSVQEKTYIIKAATIYSLHVFPYTNVILLKKKPGVRLEPETWPLHIVGPIPQGIEEAITNRLVVGWNPTWSTILISPVRSANYWRGLASGKPKAECTRLTVILSFSPEESKAQGDMW
jgi:hypothetical protein